MFKTVAGTKDIVPSDTFLWHSIETRCRTVFAAYNYEEIRTPLIEEARLFQRTLGEFTEVVQKQMFLIRNGDETYVLRPEATASIARAYLEHHWDKTKGFVKLFYLGPMFRLERPQKGRLRQFHHIGAEAIGSGSPECDVEMLALATELLKACEIDGSTLKLNSLGCPHDKKALAKAFATHLGKKKEGLCADCRERLTHNVLRILDCKKEGCREIVNSLGGGQDHLCPECKEHFQSVCRGLDLLSIRYEINPRLVRGLDYYTRTVFEFSHPSLGSQDAIGAGGRYDNLIAELGGGTIPAVGFALGMERMLLATKMGETLQPDQPLTYIIALGAEAKKESLILLQTLRAEGIRADTDYGNRSLKAALRAANDQAARWVVIIGDNELVKKEAMVKDMRTSTQRTVPLTDLIKELRC